MPREEALFLSCWCGADLSSLIQQGWEAHWNEWGWLGSSGTLCGSHVLDAGIMGCDRGQVLLEHAGHKGGERWQSSAG